MAIKSLKLSENLKRNISFIDPGPLLKRTKYCKV